MGKKKASLLDVLVRERTIKALDELVTKSRDYRETLKWQRAAFKRLDMAGLSEEQSDLVDKAVSAINDCSVAYGMAAYRLGLRDGIKLASEIRKFE
jgi:CRISPR/Cas system-associated endonuclease/helicase Cas3